MVKKNKYFFSVITVTNNINNALATTIMSALSQVFTDFQYIIKIDGQDPSSVERMCGKASNVNIISNSDAGIYDAMNQALEYVEGRFVFFLNAGDVFYDQNTLSHIYSCGGGESDIIYSPYIYRGVDVTYPKTLSRAFFFRTALCHQAYFMRSAKVMALQFNTSYQILADHDLVLRYLNSGGARFFRVSKPVSIVAPMGFSGQNYRLKVIERKKLTQVHFRFFERIRFSLVTLITMRGLRVMLLKNDRVFWLYSKLKKELYR